MNTQIKSIVAVYGSLRQGLGNSYLLKDSEHLLTAREDVNFHMISLGGYPALIKDEVKHSIVFEVYAVSRAEFQRLDQLEGYPNFYSREQVNVGGHTAWVYCMREARGWFEQGDPEVTSGDWVKHYQTKHAC